ncbi:MAG: sugar phosphate isomerase/epimerase [Verrucomicrobia bacterium]|nr:sugar phosphate isomerase/epimerase [Verrucomicrobiota bacterium]
MNRLWQAHRLALLTLFCIGLATSYAQSEAIYKQDFQSTSVGNTPDDFLVLSGKFAVNAFASNQHLTLPGIPLDSHGAIFGPENEGNLTLTTRVRSERKGRLYPSFGIGLYGLGGHILKVVPSKKSLELFRGRESVLEVPFKWESGKWTHLSLEVVSTGNGSWNVRGKAWSNGTPEPETWQLNASTNLPPTQGKASLWGQPYAGKPILYDDIVLGRPDTSAKETQVEFELGIQTWTLRNLDFDGVVEFAKEHGIRNLQVIGKHIDPHADWEEIKAKKAVLDANGLRAYTFGVAGTSMDHAFNRQLFEFAKFMGIKLIVVEPRDFAIFDSLETLVKEFDIRIAIHNHGLTSLYGNPLVVRNIIQHRDERIGVCMDAGWITAAGFDAAKVYNAYKGRVYDIHLKDKTVEITDRKLVGISANIGKGDANIKGLIEVLKASSFNGVLAIETDSPIFARQPAEFVSSAKAYYESLVNP